MITTSVMKELKHHHNWLSQRLFMPWKYCAIFILMEFLHNACRKRRFVYKCNLIPNQYFLIQNQQWKHKNNVRNLFKFNDKEYCCLLITLNAPYLNRFYNLLYCFYCWLWTGKCRLDMLRHQLQKFLTGTFY